MSDLIELVQVREDLIKLLTQLDPAPLADNINLLNRIADSRYSDTVIEKITAYQTLNADNVNIIRSLGELIDTVEHDIDTLVEETLLTQELQNKFKFNNFKSKPNTYNHKTALDDELKSIIRARTAVYSNHVYPGLILGCKFQEWIELLLASDPLYIANFNSEDLLPLLSAYPEVYQRRVRVYEINDQEYSILPQGQFSLVFSWDYFPWIFQHELDKVLVEVYNLLRPGGAFIFNYVNGDVPASASQAEQGFVSWASSHRIKQLCSKIGYEIVSFNDYDFNDPTIGFISWAELRKPGELRSMKVHQVLGEIQQK